MNEPGSKSPDDALGELFSRWLLLSRSNEPVTPEEICKHSPELLDAFREMLPSLVAMNSLFEEEGVNERKEFEGQIAEYQALAFFKEGGLGIVQVGNDPKLSRTVAIKRLKPNAKLDPNAREQFLAEASITALLEHPGIVPIYRVGDDSEGNPYYAMRLLQGETLAEAIARFHQANPTARFPRANPEFRRLIRSLISVCDTIAFAHERGIIHHDLKPDNIMLGTFNETLVLDWGLAKRLTENSHAEKTSKESRNPDNACSASTRTIKGSPAFMSPEQASGSHAADKATDVYSLGATLYVLLTGKAPFEGANPREIIAKVKSQACAPPKTIRRAVPDALAAICMKAMARSSQDRYQSASAIGVDLERWLTDEPITAMKPPMTERILRAAKRHRSLVVGSLVALLLSAAGLSILALQQYRLASYERRLNTQLNSNYRRILQIVYEVMNDDSRETTIHQISIAALSDAREYFKAQAAIDNSEYALELAAIANAEGMLHLRQERDEAAVERFHQAIYQLHRAKEHKPESSIDLKLISVTNSLGAALQLSNVDSARSYFEWSLGELEKLERSGRGTETTDALRKQALQSLKRPLQRRPVEDVR